MTLENVPANFRIPWQRLRRLHLRIRREETLQLLEKCAKDLAVHADDHPCRLKLACLVLHLPWPTRDVDISEYHHGLVIRASHALATLLTSLRLRSLHITGITGWPEQACVPKNDTLEHLRIQWLDSPITTPTAHISLPDVHRLLSQFPKLDRFELEGRQLLGLVDGHWLLAQQSAVPSPGEFAIYEPNLSSLVQYIRFTTILFFTFRPQPLPTEEPGIREFRWTRSSKEEDFVFSRWTIYEG
ncbi:hypothetical protein RTG_01702 [Rhodotorula toruloides ATCC 204091]|uniref:Uncharacterized protein n=1 Tax=Rhodotorula toruloides TaxID=5286 RepID=A0A0K3CL29_RHOTO|nr:hypothetical protein RTG_01702 [Rhodotorula toruloides ATCC 204091]PRQ71599.1 hypothetical protein AAT19DRAFT_9714 [Rhodotorula toruloides]